MAARPRVGARHTMTSSTPTRATATTTRMPVAPWNRLKAEPVL